MTRSIREALELARDRAFFASLAPELHVTNAPRAVRYEADASRARSAILARGFGAIESVVPRATCDALSRALESLQNARIPTPFLFAFDEAYEIAIGLGATFDALFAGRARVMRDVWAWRIVRGGGWKPHRGVSWDVRDARGAPTLLNAWIALSDVAVESACMHVVPLDRDPHFPIALDRVDFDPREAVPLPVPAGSVLAWNANVLHFGGAMTEGAPPRASLSFSIRSVDVEGALDPRAIGFDERIDLVADMIDLYADSDGTNDVWRDWARLDRGMRAAHHH